MSMIQKLRDKWKQNRLRRSIGTSNVENPNRPPIIETQWGDVTEGARLQAALNMKADPQIKRRVELLLIQKLGSQDAGMAEARRRYPEAYEGSE